jgi:chaperonin cofactor prefoldin
MSDNNKVIFELKEQIRELEEKLQMEIMVKKSEVLLNKELSERIEKQELHIETLLNINEDYSNKISKLRLCIKKILFDKR